MSFLTIFCISEFKMFSKPVLDAPRMNCKKLNFTSAFVSQHSLRYISKSAQTGVHKMLQIKHDQSWPNARLRNAV